MDVFCGKYSSRAMYYKEIHIYTPEKIQKSTGPTLEFLILQTQNED